MNKKRYAILGFGTVTFLFLGFLYMWSRFQTAIQIDLGIESDSAIKWAYTISIICFSLGITLDGLLGKYLSTKKAH